MWKSVALLLFVATIAEAQDREPSGGSRLPVPVTHPADEVRAAEIAFARAFADRDAGKFFSFILDDATFLGPAGTLPGKAEVTRVWSEYFKPAVAPFRWAPERVVVNAAGTLGQSMGPVHDAAGKQIGNFSSVWVKQADGSWKVLFDGPGSPPPCPAAPVGATVQEGFIQTADGARLFYHRVGTGSQVVVAPLDFVLFEDFRHLGDRFTLITYDPRNRGRSSKLPDLSSVSIESDVDDLETVRKFFNVDRFAPIGFSYLGKMVVLYAKRHPQRVERIVQLGPLQMDPDRRFPQNQQHGYEDVAATAPDVKRRREMLAKGLDKTKPRDFCEADWKVTQFVLIGNPARVGGLRSACDLENEWPVNVYPHFAALMAKKVPVRSHDLELVRMPVLTIHGTKDRNAPYGGGVEWAEHLSDGRLLTVPGAAHAVWVDAPDVVFPAIRQFLHGQWPEAAK